MEATATRSSSSVSIVIVGISLWACKRKKFLVSYERPAEETSAGLFLFPARSAKCSEFDRRQPQRERLLPEVP